MSLTRDELVIQYSLNESIKLLEDMQEMIQYKQVLPDPSPDALLSLTLERFPFLTKLFSYFDELGNAVVSIGKRVNQALPSSNENLANTFGIIGLAITIYEAIQ